MTSALQPLRDKLAAALGMVDTAIAAEPPPVATPPPIPFALKIYAVPINKTAFVTLQAQFLGGQGYYREQHHVCISMPTGSLPFAGHNTPSYRTLVYTEYRLYLGDEVNDGVQVAVSSGISGAFGKFDFTLPAGFKDGPYLARIFAYANGARVATPAETLVPFWIWTDLNGTAKDHPDYIIQSGSFDWEKLGYTYRYARLPKTTIAANPEPLVYSPAEPFNTALDWSQLRRINRTSPITMPTLNEMHAPCLTKRGITVTENVQPYYIQDEVRNFPRLPLLDGERHVCTSPFVNALEPGAFGRLRGADPYAAWTLSGEGKKTTVYGQRHKVRRYWEDITAGDDNTEIIGDWSQSGLPKDQWFAWEPWRRCFDPRTTTINPNGVPVNGVLPHYGNVVEYVPSRFGYVLKVVYDGTKDRNATAVITKFCDAKDAWALTMDNAGNLYISEREGNRISQWNVDTVKKVRDVVAGSAASFNLGVVAAQLRAWFPNAGVTLAAIRAESCVAPEWVGLQGPYLYWGSFAQKEFRRVHLTSGVIEVVARPLFDGNSLFCQGALSDGTFGPIGTLFVVTWSNAQNGYPQAFVPTPGKDPDGTPLTNAVPWRLWSYNGPAWSVSEGVSTGGTTALQYVTAITVNNGELCWSDIGGIVSLRKRQPTDVLYDANKVNAGLAEWINKGYHLVWGPFGHGYVDRTTVPLPWGESANIDYMLTANGNVRSTT